MKKILVGALLLCQLASPILADEKLELSQKDAKQLHAFLLTSELLDFGHRTKSPTAYLMAAELMMDYPTGELMKARILELCGQAKALSGRDPFVQSWAERLELRARKTSRTVNSGFALLEGTLQAEETQEFHHPYNAGWVTGEGMLLRVFLPDGTLLKEGTEIPRIESEQEKLCWILVNTGPAPSDYRVLFRQP